MNYYIIFFLIKLCALTTFMHLKYNTITNVVRVIKFIFFARYVCKILESSSRIRSYIRSYKVFVEEYNTLYIYRRIIFF